MTESRWHVVNSEGVVVDGVELASSAGTQVAGRNGWQVVCGKSQKCVWTEGKEQVSASSSYEFIVLVYARSKELLEKYGDCVADVD